MKRLCGVAAVLFVLSGCATSPCTFKYTPEMQSVRERALAGDVCAMRQMATYHWIDTGRDASHEEACRWLQRATDAGDAMSAELLGWCYLTGDGVPQSRENAARQFFLAGCAYWNRWQYVFYENDISLCTYLFRPYSVPCDGWSCDDASRSVGNLNRAILLGNHSARMQKGVLYLQLARWISSRIQANEIDENSKLKELISEIERFRIKTPNVEKLPCGAKPTEDLKACDSGSMPGLYDAVVAEICVDDCTRVADLVELARGISALPTTDTFDMQPFPAPHRIVVCGLKPAAADDWRGYVSFRSFAVFDVKDVPKFESAYRQLHEKDRRSYAILRMSKALPRFYATLGADGVRQLFARIVREAKLSETEKEVNLPCCLKGDEWWLDHE